MFKVDSFCGNTRRKRSCGSFRMGRNGSESSERCVDMKHFYSDRAFIAMISVHINTGIVGSLNIKSSKLKKILSRAQHDGSSDVRQKDRLTRVSLPGIVIGKSITGRHLKHFFQLYLLEHDVRHQASQRRRCWRSWTGLPWVQVVIGIVCVRLASLQTWTWIKPVTLPVRADRIIACDRQEVLQNLLEWNLFLIAV